MSDMMVKNNGSSLVEKKEPVRPGSRRVTFAPQVDILELPDGLVLTLDLPGVKPEDVEVHFERGELIVKGKRQPLQRPAQCLVEELEVGDYHRGFLISQDIAADKITADLKNGVLTVQLPKASSAQPRRIQVKG